MIVPHLVFIVITVGGLVAQVWRWFYSTSPTQLVVCIVAPATIFYRILRFFYNFLFHFPNWFFVIAELHQPQYSIEFFLYSLLVAEIEFQPQYIDEYTIPLLYIILMTLPTTYSSSCVWQTTIGPVCCHHFCLRDNVSYILRDGIQKKMEKN